MGMALHILLVLFLPPLLLGVINKTKAFVGGRNGPPLLQVYYDLAKLCRKGFVFSETTTGVFLLGPVIGLSSVLLAALIVPLGQTDAPLSFTGDLILFAYLLALGRFFTILAALDTGSAFEGMGAAREATYACLAEPVLFFGLLGLAKISGALTLAGLLDVSLLPLSGTVGAALLLIFVSWFVLLLVENCRIPFDDPNTHLELTMIHEVMVLDHSGPALGMIVYGAAIKLFLFAALIVRLIVPLGTGIPFLDWVLFVSAVLVVAVVVGMVESNMARLRLVSIPRLLIAASVLSAFGLVLIVTHT